jgi:hypothetical protein
VSDPWGQQQQPGGEWSSPQGSQGGSESGSFGPPPADPQYGAPAPQYGAPPQQQPQYGAPQPTYGEQAQYGAPPQQPYDQSQYGAAPPPYGGQVPPAGGYGYPMPPQQEQKNGFSVAGLILSILPLLGIIFSILGLTRAAKIGGKGRGLAIAGLVLSLAFAGGYSALLIAASHSTALDPGCTSAEASFRSMLSKIQADESKLSADESSSDQTAMQQDLGAFTNDVQGIKTALDSALGQAQHQSVKDKIQAMDTDINTVLTGLQAIEKGDTSQITQFSDAAGRLGSDGDALDNLCSSL